MPWGPRVAETSTNFGEGDKLYVYGQYSGPSGQLTAFMPLYKDVSDAAEYGYILPATQIAVGPFAKLQSAGKVTLATTAVGSPTPITPGSTVNINAGAISTGVPPVFIGAYSPTNPNDRPSNGDVVRITRFGVTPVQISAGGAPAVGDYILTQENSPFFTTLSAYSVAATSPSLGAYAGRVVATGTQISGGTAISPVPSFSTATSGYLAFLVNGWLDK